MDIGGHQFHPGEIGRRGFVAVSWVEIEFRMGRNRQAMGRPRGHDMLEAFVERKKQKEPEVNIKYWMQARLLGAC